jgi:hypothetical protein
VNKQIENGEIKSANRDIETINEAMKNSCESAGKISDFVKTADMPKYLSSGDFTAQLFEECRLAGIDIVGEDSTFEVFPYRLKLDPPNAELQINGRKAPGLRPKMIAAPLAKGREKLLAGAFNPVVFLEEVAEAYDISIIAAARGKPTAPDQDVYLSAIYKYLTPMRRFRRDYDTRSFAFDLSKLYAFLDTRTSDGRSFQFGPSRQNNRAIRIVDETGFERFLATIRFFKRTSDMGD